MSLAQCNAAFEVAFNKIRPKAKPQYTARRDALLKTTAYSQGLHAPMCTSRKQGKLRDIWKMCCLDHMSVFARNRGATRNGSSPSMTAERAGTPLYTAPLHSPPTPGDGKRKKEEHGCHHQGLSVEDPS